MIDDAAPAPAPAEDSRLDALERRLAVLEADRARLNADVVRAEGRTYALDFLMREFLACLEDPIEVIRAAEAELTRMESFAVSGLGGGIINWTEPARHALDVMHTTFARRR